MLKAVGHRWRKVYKFNYCMGVNLGLVPSHPPQKTEIGLESTICVNQ